MADMANKFSEKLLSDIEDFLSATGMSSSYFGKQAAKNSELVKRLRAGRPIQSDTESKVREFMRQNRSRLRQAESA